MIRTTIPAILASLTSAVELESFHEPVFADLRTKKMTIAGVILSVNSGCEIYDCSKYTNPAHKTTCQNWRNYYCRGYEVSADCNVSCGALKGLEEMNLCKRK